MEVSLHWAPQPGEVSAHAECGPQPRAAVTTVRSTLDRRSPERMEGEEIRLSVQILSLGRTWFVCQPAMRPDQGWWGLTLEVIGWAGLQGEKAIFRTKGLYYYHFVC